MPILIELAIGVLILAVAGLIFTIGLKMIKENGKSDAKPNKVDDK